MRARPQHPGTPRPVILNTWESVYFDLDLPTLLELAEAGAEVGVERYVLDDGWFVGRRDDHADPLVPTRVAATGPASAVIKRTQPFSIDGNIVGSC